MKIITPLRRSLLPLLATVFLFTPVFAQAQDAIGRIIQAAGVVTAVNATGAERRIARGSEIFEGETVTTGPRGSAQLRLTDGAVISLEIDTFFTVDDYEYDGAGGAADTTIMTMARGTMRTLTGVIGDDPADTYELNTPFASIGVRGTEYAVVVEPNGQVRVFVFDGSVAVSPPGGGGGAPPTVVGLAGDADAVTVSTDAVVTEADLSDPDSVPPAIRAVVERLQANPVSDRDVNRLPPANSALQIQENVQQAARQQQASTQTTNSTNNTNASGNLVDADGRVQFAANEDEFIQARTVVIISVTENDPDSFDVSTVVSATPNR